MMLLYNGLMTPEQALEFAYTNPDLLIKTGSRLYGTNREDSDVDLRGVCIPPWEYLVTRVHPAIDPKSPINHMDFDGDHVVFGIGFFVVQLLACNPQFFELLYAPESHVLRCNDVGKGLMSMRELIASKRFYKRILGFAESEWRKARGVKVIIPERTLTEEQVIQDIRTVFGPHWGDKAKENMDAILDILFSGHETKEVPSVDGISKKRRFEFEAYGYCCSSACHALRLVRQCTELLQTSKMTFPRPDADQLRDIKHGRMTLEEVTPLFDAAMSECEGSVAGSFLQEKPDAAAIRAVYEKIIARALVNDKRLQEAAKPDSTG